MNVHIHLETRDVFPEASVVAFARWTLSAVARHRFLQGFRAIPKNSHVWICTSKKPSHGITYEDGVVKLFLMSTHFPAPGGDGRFLDGIDFVCFDWVEMLVSLLAHEGAHLRGVPGLNKEVLKKMGIWATGGRTGEQLAQVISLDVLEQFRLVRATIECQLQNVSYMIE